MKLYNLLKKNKNFRNLFIAGLIDQLGTWFHSTSLMIIIIKTLGSAEYVSYSLMAISLPALLFSSKIGDFVDRSNLIRVMFLCNILNTILALFYIFATESIALIMLLNGLVSILHLGFSSSRGKFIGCYLDVEQRQAANGAIGMIVAIMAILGASAGGVVTSFLSITVVFVVNALTFLVSAFFIARIPIHLGIYKKEIAITEVKKKSSIVDTFKMIKRLEFVPQVVLLGVTWGICGGAYIIALPFYGKEVFGLGDSGIAVMYVIQGIGMFVGCIVAGEANIKKEESRRDLFLVSYGLQAICFIVFALGSNFWISSLALVIMRVCSGVIIPLDTTLLQNNTPESSLAKVLSFHYSVYGMVMKEAYKSIKAKENIECFDDFDELKDKFDELTKNEVRIAVKASRGVRLERLINE